MFPRHECGLHLTHNNHKDYYETVEQYFENPWMNGDISTEEKQKMIDTNEVWELQWYPDTPVSFYKVLGSTFEGVCKEAVELQERVDVQANES